MPKKKATVPTTIPDFEAAIEATEEVMQEEKEWSVDSLIRVEDDQGHLLFKYNPSTKAIEIKVPVGRSADKGKVFMVSTDTLRNAGATNFISDKPVMKVTAELMNGKKPI